MAKKVLSIVLSLIMLLSTLAVASFATTDYALVNKDGAAYASYKVGIDSKFFYACDKDGNNYITENIAANIYFWDQEVNTAYYAATTEADYKNVWNLMNTPQTEAATGEPYEDDFWYLHRDESKAVITLKFVADKETAKPGDTVNVDVYATTNFWAAFFNIGIIYDKTLVTLGKLTYDSTSMDGFEMDIENPDFGFVHHDDGTIADCRWYMWPPSMRGNKDSSLDDAAATAAKAQYGMALVSSSTSYTHSPIVYAKKFNNTHVFSYAFTVNADAAAGSTARFFVSDDSNGRLSELPFYEENMQVTLIQVSRAADGLNSDDQQGVDSIVTMGQTVVSEDANVTIVADAPAAADYTKLDAATAEYDGLVATKATYTTASWTAYETAATAGKALSRDLLATEQTTVDNATKAITDAKAALVTNGIVSVAAVGDPIIGANASVNVTVAGSPASIRFMDGNVATTFTRDQATITTSGDNEIWNVKLLASVALTNYKVYVAYTTNEYLDSYKDFALTATEGLDLSIHSMTIPDMEDGCILLGRHIITMTTSTDVWKIQFVGGNGSTYTYATDYTSYVDNGNERTWTINHNFNPLGTWTMGIRTRAASTTFETVDGQLAATVLY